MEEANERAERIRSALQSALEPVHLLVQDESEKHAGHAGGASGGGHFRVTVVSERFEGRSRVERHRMLHEALGDAFEGEVHAMAIRAVTPAEWEG